VILGRDGEITIRDRRVSRKHAVIEAISRENIYIRDLMSKNGTFVNGVKVQTYKLKAGDIIRLGDTDLELLIEDEP
jgi:S-DNA-T family DNA segregation ATPase FtsK/SpoIIIE